MQACFMTGFPGFISSRLLKALQERHPHAAFILLVHPSQLEKAERLVQNFANVRILRGDITDPKLGLSDEQLEELIKNVTHVFHLAAVYDLAVPKALAEKVNVEGTDHVNRFVRSLEKLERYIYFSTAYVSGDRTGIIKEDELDVGQGFKNHYEATKFAAEKLVRDLRDVPVTIIRPGIVVGDSVTGETAKFDGPYFIMRFLDRMGRLPVAYIGKAEAPLNVVPVDYIVKAVLYLSETDKAIHRTFHLTDPSPYRSRDVFRMICEAQLGKTPSWTIAPSLVKALLSFSALRRFYGVEKEALDYFRATCHYDTTHARRVLAEGGIFCPDFKDYVQRIVDYYKQHRHDPEKNIPIA